MAEFWAFMGKARGFTVGLHSKNSLETGTRPRTGTVYLLDSGPLHQDQGRSRVEASGCITRPPGYLNGLNRPSGPVFPVSPAKIKLYIEHSRSHCIVNFQPPPPLRQPRTSTRPYPHISISTRAQVGDLQPPVVFIGRNHLILQCSNDQHVHQSSVQRL